MIPAFLDPAAMRIEPALFTPNGRFVRPGHIVVEGAAFYVHPDSWERVSSMLAMLPVKR